MPIATRLRSVLAFYPMWLGMAAALPGSVTRADFPSMASRLPASTDAVIAVNVAKILQSPYAKAQQWAMRTTDEWAKNPTMIPPGSSLLLMGADLDTSTMQSGWELSLMEMPTMPALADIAKAEGGHIERLWDKDAVESPINAYFVPLDTRTMASITPAARQQVVRWLREPAKPEGNVTSPYIRQTLATLGDKTDVLMALDLEGALSIPRIRKALDEVDIKEIKSEEMDALARTLGSMKGIRLEVRIDDKMTAKGTIHFDKDVSNLKTIAKPLMIAVLNRAGMRLDDVSTWNFQASDKQIIMEGNLSNAGLRKLLGMVQSPVPALTAAKPSPGDPATAADPAKASQRYFKAVCGVLDNLHEGNSMSESAAWMRQAAKRIEQLPILNVDPVLVEWGAMVTTRLKQAGGGLSVNQTQTNSRVAGVMDPTYGSYGYDANGDYYTTGYDKGEVENARKQRQSAAQEQKAKGHEQALGVLNQIAETRPKVRADMVAKYKVEF